MCSYFSNMGLGLVVEYIGQQILPMAKQKRNAQQAELALFGTRVACVESTCSNCLESRRTHSCNCKVWTCQCTACCETRGVYNTTEHATKPYKVPMQDHDKNITNCTQQVCGKLPAIAMVSKECLATFQAYIQSETLKQICLQSVHLTYDLALYGPSVGCADNVCSVCVMPLGECPCKTWTCRCHECWKLRNIYRDIIGSPSDVMFYQIVDDATDDVWHQCRCLGMAMFGDADYESFEGDIKHKLSQMSFTKLEPHTIDQISECFQQVANIRRDRNVSNIYH